MIRKLKSLNVYGKEVVQDEFLATPEHDREFTEEQMSEVNATFDPEMVRQVLSSTMQQFPREPDVDVSHMDVGLAPALHQALPLDRFTAAETGVWHYLCAVEYPEFVRHRWGNETTGTVNKDRFLGPLKRNALARLWWGAELSVLSGDYSATRLLFAPRGGQDLFEQVLGRRFSNYPPAVQAFLKKVEGKKRKVIRPAAETLSQTLTTVVLEAMDQNDIERLVSSIMRRVEAPTQGELLATGD